MKVADTICWVCIWVCAAYVAGLVFYAWTTP